MLGQDAARIGAKFSVAGVGFDGSTYKPTATRQGRHFHRLLTGGPLRLPLREKSHRFRSFPPGTNGLEWNGGCRHLAERAAKYAIDPELSKKFKRIYSGDDFHLIDSLWSQLQAIKKDGSMSKRCSDVAA
jgi:hypothetical protein